MKSEVMPEMVKMSSKGQLVIPKEYREEMELDEGSVIAVMKSNNTLVLKKVDNPILKEDLETLKDIKEAWKDIEKGDYFKFTKEKFLEELDKW